MPRLRGPLLSASVAIALAMAWTAPAAQQPKHLSVHNRLLLNRLAVAGQHTVEVMLMLDPSDIARASAAIERRGGRIRRSEPAIGYVRAEMPIEQVTAVGDDPGIAAYQISSLSKRSWYRDAAPQANAEMFRGFETAPIVRASSSPPASDGSDLPLLSPEASRLPGYTADEDAGVGEWIARHPTYDGRGVTIALLETAQAEFAHPTICCARTLDGREVPKIAGILNALDPDEPDDTRVDLTLEVHSPSTWCRAGGRTYILPRAGTYRFGFFSLPAGNSLVEQFAVLRNEATGEIRVDSDGDGDFRSEPPVADVNTRFEPRTLRLHYPRAADVSFVVAQGSTPHRVHVYVARSGHQAMTIGVAAGSQTGDGLASGVAPAARVLLVRTSSIDFRLRDFFEGYLDAIRRPDVDILSDSSGVTLVPDTSDDFAGVFFRRLISVYRKPIFRGAGNSPLVLNSAVAMGDAFSVGGSIGPATFSSLYGGGAIESTIVHPLSAAGPAMDGVLAPDFVAPMHRLAADVLTNDGAVLLPRAAPTIRLPRGYAISCCTSASSPYAAGVAALLLSAARQTDTLFSIDTLGRALRVGARFLPDAPAHQQGSGALDVDAAWREMQRKVEIPRIQMRADNVHALTPYAASGGVGAGLFEREGWHAGSHGKRVVELTRESGPTTPTRYRVSWTGNDGTFQTSPSVTLPSNKPASLSIAIAALSPGVHSAILDLHDPATDAIVFRGAATIVASETIDPETHVARLGGSVPLMHSQAHYLSVPEGVEALDVELDVLDGSVSAAVLPSHGLIREYFGHVSPQFGRTFTKGRYRILLPRPSPGTWSITLTNDSAWREANRTLVSTEKAVYSIVVRCLTASLAVRKEPAGRVAVALTNEGAAIRAPAIDVSTGTLRTHRGDFLANGLPNQFTIDVPEGTAALTVRARTAAAGNAMLDLYLYDCSSGECFSYDFTTPAARAHAFVVRKPAAGRWIAAVAPSPFPGARVRFELDSIVTHDVHRISPEEITLRPSGATWTEVAAVPPFVHNGPGGTGVLVFELIDVAAERDAITHPWETREGLPNLADRSIAIGTAILRLN